MTWDELFERFVRATNLRPASVRGYRNDLKLFLAQAQIEDPRELTEGHLRTYFLWLKASGLQEATVTHRIRAVVRLLRWGTSRDLLILDPARDFTVPRPRRNIPRLLTRADVDRLIEATQLHLRRFCRARDRALLELLYGTGLRIGEAAGLRVSDVDLADAALNVKWGKSRPRRTPFGPVVAAALEDYLEVRSEVAQSGEMSFFVAQHGSRVTSTSLGSVLRYYSKKTGIAASPHDFRRAFATHLLENGANIVEVKALLGHADLSSTQFYTQIAPVELTRAFNRSHPRARRSR